MTPAEAEARAQEGAAAYGYDGEIAVAFQSGYRAAHAAALADPRVLTDLHSPEDFAAAARVAGAASGIEASRRFAFEQGYTTLLAYAAKGQGPDKGIPIGGEESPKKIKDRYIIVFRDDAPDGVVEGLIQHARAQGEVQHVYGTVFRGIAAALPETAIKAFQHNPHVRSIDADQTVQVEATTQLTPPSWGLSRIDSRPLAVTGGYTYADTAGRGINVYVIDTGVQSTHSDFGGRASLAKAIVNETTPDGNGHGTHTAGTVGSTTYGVAKLATIKGVKVLNSAGSGTYADVVAGIQFVAEEAKKNTSGRLNSVGSMSLGGPKSQAVNDAVSAAVDAGVVMVVAAGNNNADACALSPAGTPKAITVGATDKTDTRATYSNFGTCLDIFAPGSDITSLWKGADGATNTISGTSMAAPHVAGVAALYMSAVATTTVAQVRDAIVNLSTKGLVKNPGVGSPNALLYNTF